MESHELQRWITRWFCCLTQYHLLFTNLFIEVGQTMKQGLQIVGISKHNWLGGRDRKQAAGSLSQIPAQNNFIFTVDVQISWMLYLSQDLSPSIVDEERKVQMICSYQVERIRL